MRHGNRQARSGIVTDETKITFRSRSSRIFWLIQMSVELWDYAAPYPVCEIYWDKFVGFCHELFWKWKAMEVTHSLTVIFFSRTFVQGLLGQKDVYGRKYEDHFQMVIENETRADWDSLIVKLKEAFWQYPSLVGWNLASDHTSRRPSTANQGNVLEAINTTLNLLQYHYYDRDLHRTGNSIVLVSAGGGVFEVERGLAAITYQRMMDNGIGSDMLSLGLPPLHIAPFFMYVNDFKVVETDSVDTSESYFEVPHWMHLSFVGYESEVFVPGEYTNDEDDAKKAARVDENDTGLRVGANGFILSQNKPKKPITLPVPSGKVSFTAEANAAASPPRPNSEKVVQERQLIADRDFDDILQACRPRHTSASMPPALTSMLTMVERSKQAADDSSAHDGSVEEGESDRELPDWGSLDHPDERQDDSVGSLLASKLPQLGMAFPASPSSPVLSPRLHDLERHSPVSSVGSSYLSNMRFGVSYDRSLTKHGSPSNMSGQLQRAPSLELDVNDDADSQSEAGMSDASHSELSRDDGSKKKESRSITAIRRLMRAYDLGQQEIQPRAAMVPDAATENSGEESSSPVNMIAPSRVSSYSTLGSAQAGQPTMFGMSQSPHRFIPSEAGTALPSRIGSGSRFAGAARRGMLEVDPTGLSPLLLPPVVAPNLDGTAPNFSGRGLLERRLIPPVDLLRSRQAQAVSDRELSGETSASRSPQSSSVLHHAMEQKGGSPLSSSDRMLLRGDSMMRSPSRPASAMVRPDRMSSGGSNQAHASKQAKARHHLRSRRKKAFNPFRQEDEDEELAEKSHNRRRWSHVFPLGEVEFKRHVRLMDLVIRRDTPLTM